MQQHDYLSNKSEGLVIKCAVAGCSSRILPHAASPEAHPVEVSLALREKGLRAYRVEFDFEADAWIVRLIDWDLAA
jgi:hypothetical protein